MKKQEETPTLETLSAYVKNPVFDTFIQKLKDNYQVQEKIEYSGCSMMPGWNIKFKKSGKSLCTIYPHESYFTVLVVVGKKEKELVEGKLSSYSLQIQDLYRSTEEGMGQKWLMIDLEDENECVKDTFNLISIRAQK